MEVKARRLKLAQAKSDAIADLLRRIQSELAVITGLENRKACHFVPKGNHALFQSHRSVS